MKDIFFFDSMLTPKIITFVYWLILIGTLISGVTTMFAKYGGGLISGLGDFWGDSADFFSGSRFSVGGWYSVSKKVGPVP